MSSPAGISASGRTDLARVLATAGRFVRSCDVVSALGVDQHAAAQKLARWAQEGWLRRVRRGLYIPVPVEAQAPSSWSEGALAVATEVWAPCYFTGWTAANHWGLTEQVFRTTVLKTAQRVRTSEVRLLDQDYLVSHAPEAEMAWGLETIWLEDVRVRIADPARTIVDILDSPRLGGGIRHVAEILTAYLEEHDSGRLLAYGDRVGNRTVFKRLGYLAETLGIGDESLIQGCLERLSAGVSLIDPDAPARGTRSMRWRVRVNVQVSRLDPT